MTSEPPFRSFKLPRGRHGLSRQHVAENQRWRLMGATLDLLAEEPYLKLTSHKVARRAATSSQAFYACFDNLDDCLLSTFEAGAAHFRSVIYGNCEETEQARTRIGQATTAACALLMRERSFGRLLSLELRAAAPALAEPYGRLIETLSEDLQRAARPSKGAPALRSSRAHLLVHAVCGLLSQGYAPPSSTTAEQLADLLTARAATR
ncbi:MAG: TetR/AcrR family transcriptional regulator [Solirubrobacterales bacterium]